MTSQAGGSRAEFSAAKSRRAQPQVPTARPATARMRHAATPHAAQTPTIGWPTVRAQGELVNPVRGAEVPTDDVDKQG